MEANQPQSTCICFPSRLPQRVSAIFPPVKQDPDVKVLHIRKEKHVEVTNILKEEKLVHLFNPPRQVIKQLSAKQPVTLSFDFVPETEMLSLLRLFRVQVPSLAFRAYFRQQGIQAEMIQPVPLLDHKKQEIRTLFRKQLHRPEKLLIWVDERFIKSKVQQSLVQSLQFIQKQFSSLQIVWVGKRLINKSHGWMRLNPKDADRYSYWLAADLILTIAPKEQSLSPVHVQILSQGIPVMTCEGGDHDEWVKHMHSGILLNRSTPMKELRFYLTQLLKNPRLISHFKYNAHQLIKR